MRNETLAILSKALVLVASTSLAGAGPSYSTGTATSAGATVTVSGDSVPSDCGAAKKADYAMELKGSLAGCWSIFVAHTNCQEMNGFAYWTEIGREEFDGKFEGQATSFNTEYKFNAVFPSGSCPKPSPEKEIVGGCIHYLSGNNLIGEMRFHDVMYGKDAPHFFYEGTLTHY